MPLPIIPLFGTGIVASAGAASASSCMARARAYVETANGEIFLKRGLRCKVLKMRSMMLAVGCGSEVLALPPLDTDMVTGADSGGRLVCDDPKMRRVRALGNRVAGINLKDCQGQRMSKAGGRSWVSRRLRRETRR